MRQLLMRAAVAALTGGAALMSGSIAAQQSAPAPAERVVENKKGDMQEYMERAAGLVHQYVPPDPEAVDRATADVVSLNVQFGALADDTSYASQTTLDAKAKDISVVIQNSGHRRVGP